MIKIHGIREPSRRNPRDTRQMHRDDKTAQQRMTAALEREEIEKIRKQRDKDRVWFGEWENQ